MNGDTKTQQTHTFSGGMDTDTSDLFLKNDRYRFAKNLRYITNTGSTGGELHTIPGWKQIPLTLGKDVNILAATTVRDLGVFVVQHDTYWEVVTFDKQKFTCVFKCAGVLSTTRVSVVGRQETDDVCKLYIADGEHPLMAIDLLAKAEHWSDIDDVIVYPSIMLKKPVFNRLTSGSLKSGCVQYTYRLYTKHGSGSEMAPITRPIQIPNKPFSSNKSFKGVAQDKKTSCGVVLDIDLDGRPEKFDHILVYRISYEVVGQLPSVECIYDGKVLTNDFTITDSGQTALSTLTLEEFNSISGVHIIPKIIESKNDYLFAGNVREYTSNTFDDYDARAYSFNKDGAAHLRNAYDDTYEVASTTDDLSSINPKTDCYNTFTNVNDEYEQAENLDLFDRDGYYGGSGANVSWRFVVTELYGDTCKSHLSDDPTVGNSNIGTSHIVIQSASEALKTKTKCAYIKRGGTLEVFETDMSYHSTNGIGTTYSDTATSMVIKSLRRDEVYRYGIILYDKCGFASTVKWIADIRVPSVLWNGFESFYAHGGDDGTVDLVVRPIGVEFDVKMPDGCIGYEIVRCPRKESDVATISQGVISRPVRQVYRGDKESFTQVYTPTGFLTTNRFWAGSLMSAHFGTADNTLGYESDNFDNNTLFQFVSPEVVYQKTSFQDLVGKQQLTLNPIKYVFGAASTVPGLMRHSSNNKAVYRGIYPSAGNGHFPIGANTYIDYTQVGTDGTGGVTKRRMINNDTDCLYPVLYGHHDGVDLVNLFYKIRSSFASTNLIDDNYKMLDDIDMQKTYQYNAVLPQTGDCYITEDLKYVGPSILGESSGTNNVSDGGFYGVRNAAYMYIKLYEQSNDVLQRVHASDNIAATGEGGDTDAIDYNPTRQEISPLRSFDVKDTEFVHDLSWDDYAEKKQDASGDNSWNLTYRDKLDTIGSSNYCNWVCGGVYDQGISAKPATSGLNKDNFLRDCALMGPGGRCMLIKLSNTGLNTAIAGYPEKAESQMLFDTFATDNVIGGSASFTNLSNKYPNYPTPESFDYYHHVVYGHRREDQLEQTMTDIYPESLLGTFICNLRRSVIPYGGNTTSDKQLNTYASYGDYFTTSGKHVVFDGDCYIQPMEYVSMHKMFNSDFKNMKTMMVAYAIPLETSINLAYTYGYELSRNIDLGGNITQAQIEPANVMNQIVQTDPMYSYNTAYSSDSTAKMLSAEQEDTFDKIDVRVMYSGQKENGERIDNWTKFQANNYLDVDTRYGELTGLRTFKDKLIYWQKGATGVLSVNERAQITDNTNMPLILGTGDVLARYDYILTTNGMRPDQYCDTESDSAVYWLDADHKEICAYTSEGAAPLSKIKFISNYMNKHDMNDKPVLTYDKKFNEVLCHVTDDETLVYNEITQAFTGVYTIKLQASLQFTDSEYFIHDSQVYKWNEFNQDDSFKPYLKYIVNDNPTYVKVFDNVELGLTGEKDNINVRCHTHVGTGTVKGEDITDREYSYRYAVPRVDKSLYGNRMRDKAMVVEMTNDTHDELSIQYITTKYRISWS